MLNQQLVEVMYVVLLNSVNINYVEKFPDFRQTMKVIKYHPKKVYIHSGNHGCIHSV